MNGTLPIHLELERELAEWLGEDDALVYTAGYLANTGSIATLLEPGDTVICDAGDHASILDAVSMSRARIRPLAGASTSSRPCSSAPRATAAASWWWWTASSRWRATWRMCRVAASAASTAPG